MDRIYILSYLSRTLRKKCPPVLNMTKEMEVEENPEDEDGVRRDLAAEEGSHKPILPYSSMFILTSTNP